MSERQEDMSMNEGSEGLRPQRSRLRELLRDALFVIALVGIYLLMMLFVLPRLGYET